MQGGSDPGPRSTGCPRSALFSAPPGSRSSGGTSRGTARRSTGGLPSAEFPHVCRSRGRTPPVRDYGRSSSGIRWTAASNVKAAPPSMPPSWASRPFSVSRAPSSSQQSSPSAWTQVPSLLVSRQAGLVHTRGLLECAPGWGGGARPRNVKEARVTSSTETGGATGTPDKDYNLIWYGEACLSNALRLDGA